MIPKNDGKKLGNWMDDGVSFSSAPQAKAAHVNLMTDTVIANLPTEGLRAVIRGMLVSDSSITSTFLDQSRAYLTKSSNQRSPILFKNCASGPGQAVATRELEIVQRKARCLMGCGLGFESLALLTEIVKQATPLRWDEDEKLGQQLMDHLAAVDGDIVQAFTAVHKELAIPLGSRGKSATEGDIWKGMVEALRLCREQAVEHGVEFMFERALSSSSI